MTTPYYSDESVTLYHGDCREITEWLAADVLITDPPYGRAWRQGAGMTNSQGQGNSKAHPGITGDRDTTTRDEALALWGDRPAVVFGDPLIAAPAGAVQALGYRKPSDAGIKGARAGFRRDLELIYLLGSWPAGIGGRSSILTTSARVASSSGIAALTGHPHAKPLDLIEELVSIAPDGVIADSFSGSGPVLVVAKRLGLRAIGVETEERHCETTAKRCAQEVLNFDSEAIA